MFSNPALRKTIDVEQVESDLPMTLTGTVQKTAVLLALLVFAAGISHHLAASGTFSLTALIAFGVLGGLVVAQFIIANPEVSMIMAPQFAVLEGIVIGALTFIAESALPGVAIPTVGLTFIILGIMLAMWRRNSFRVTLRFQRVLLISIMGIVGMYLVTLWLAIFGVNVLWPHTHPILNMFAAVVASLCFMNDFHKIETRLHNGAPAYMEWYSAFGLMVTLVWLYLELLQLMGNSD